MNASMRPSGIPVVGDMPWGTHFCHFFDDQRDLVETLVPYFKAGLEQDEACTWVTAEPCDARAAREALFAAMPDLPAREARGQIEIVDHSDLYARRAEGGADDVLASWVRREGEVTARGFAGLRITGNSFFVERSGWRAFDEYESRVSAAFADHRILALCSYAAHRCDARCVLDVVRNHEFALARRDGAWEMVESASLQHAKAQLRRLNEELEARVLERTERLEAALRVRDEFLSVASHELRTPLASLKLYIAGLARGTARGSLSPQDTLARLRKAEGQCDRLEALLANLLELTRARSGRLTIAPEPLDLAPLCRGCAERFADEFVRLGRALVVEAPGPIEGAWDRLRIEQVLTNLIANAVKYAPESPVFVRAVVDGDDAVLTVRDQGPGIAPADRARVFERFEQVTPGTSGFGLGLWIVRRIVEAHAGTIDIESEPGRGAAFIVRLPRRAA